MQSKTVTVLGIPLACLAAVGTTTLSLHLPRRFGQSRVIARPDAEGPPVAERIKEEKSEVIEE